jgi:hypothetical protein
MLMPAEVYIAEKATTSAADTDLTEIPTMQWLPKPVENPAAEASDPSGMKAYTEQISGTELKLAMVPIPGDTFKMGSSPSEAGHQHGADCHHEWQHTR